MQQPTEGKRINYLDAVRGIAASMVMVYHYTGWKYSENIWIKISHLIFNGSDAVSFFFVLSGFVLAYPYLHFGKSLDVGKFYVNRIFRIYPGFLVALIINVLYAGRHNFLQHPFAGFNHHFWEEAYLLKGASSYLALDWTLTIEMVLSFLMPFLIAMTKHNNRLIVWFVFLNFFLFYIIGVFVLPFALGILICVYFDKIRQPEFRQTKWYRYRTLLLVFAFLLFSVRHLDRIFPFGKKYAEIAGFFQMDFFVYTAVASFIFIVFIIHFGSIQKFLEKKVLIFIGKISYGIYLMHWVFVAAIFDYWDALNHFFPNTITTFIVMMIACTVATLISATLLYYYVEKPCIQLGKRITKRMKTTLVIR